MSVASATVADLCRNGKHVSSSAARVRFHSVTFERRYRDGEGNWHSAHGYDVNDLLTLAKLVDQAHSRIVELQTATKPAA